MSIYPGANESEVEVDGDVVPYVDSVRSKGEPRPIVLVHGSGGTARSHFGALFPMLASRRRVIALDYGSVPAPDRELTLDAVVAKVRAVLDDAVPGEPVDLVGYSLGAVVSIALAAERPERCASLTLIAGWLRTDSHQRIRNRVWRTLFEAGSDALGAFAVLNAYSAQYLAKLSPAEAAALVERSSPGPDRARQMRLNAEVDVLEAATRVSAPTLIIGCDHDQIAPLHHSRQMLGAIGDARMARVRAGHAVLTERPAEVYQLVDAFTQRPDEYPAGAHIPPIVV